MLDKRTLTIEELDRQTAMELPERDTMLVTVILNNVLNNNTVTITVENIDLALNVCAGVVATVDCEFSIDQ